MFDYGVGIRNPLFFVGVIENNVDPRREGRVKVRAFGVHGTNKEVRPDELPWAIVVQGDYNPNNIPRINSWVFGMFIDGRAAQQPMVLGLIPTQMTEIMDPVATGWGVIPDRDGALLANGSDPESFGQPQQSRLARGENVQETYVLGQEMGRTMDVPIGGAVGEQSWSEPASAYNAEYPHNRVIETGAHSIELDDTPGAERIMIHHKSGSYVQIDSRGTKTDKTASDKFEVIDRKQHVSVGGMSTVTINGNSYVYVKGDKVEEIEGDLQTLVHGNHLLSVGGQSNIIAGEQVQVRGADLRLEANIGTFSIKAGKELQTEAGIGWYAKAPFIWAEATSNMNLKGNNLNIFGTTQTNIKSADLNIIGTGTADMRGGVLTLGSDGELHVRGTTVNIDDNVNMANDAAATAHAAGDVATAEPSISAEVVDSPEPVAKSTSLRPEDSGSRGSSGYSSQDDTAEGTGSSGTATFVSSEPVSVVTTHAAKPLLELIIQAESASQGGYDAISGLVRSFRRPSKPITQMTIGELLDWQDSIDDKQDSEASGAYQIVEDTLRGFDNGDLRYGSKTNVNNSRSLYEKVGLTKSDLFSPENQDKMAIELLRYRGLDRFLAGTLSRGQFGNNLAAEWAGLPLIEGPNAGSGRYDGDAAGNQAKEDFVQNVINALDEVKRRATFMEGITV